jgi:short subunit dehydrogenase-like uncharacterized protein
VGLDRDYDLVVFGASGFVGKLTAGYLGRNAPPGARIALAGRSRSKLLTVRDQLGPAAADWPVIVSDASDTAGLASLAASSRVVATTVGPYMSYGLPLVEACAAAGTHYADLTGEVRFVRESIDRCDGVAQESGARIVHSCGFDSIPSDLGVLALYRGVQAAGAGDLEETRLVLTTIKGGVSGGTLASIMRQLDDMKSDPSVRRLVADPYALSPDRAGEPDVGRQRDPIAGIDHDAALNRWLIPFFMASFNTRIVRRSNALQGWAYGRRLRYSESQGFPSGLAGLATGVVTTAGLGALAGGLMFGPTRSLLGRVLPAPGAGPSEKVQQRGRFALEIHARTSTGAGYVATVTGRGDPGYAGTAVMLGEAALSLAFDGAALPDAAGVLTPATGLGVALIDRLCRQPFGFDVRPTVVT